MNRRIALITLTLVLVALGSSAAGIARAATTPAPGPFGGLRSAAIGSGSMSAAAVPHATSTSVIPSDPVTNLPFTQAWSLAIDDAHRQVFVSGVPDSGTGALMALGFDGQVVATIEDEAGASGLALDGGSLYVARCNQGLIDVIDTASLTRTASISVDPGPSGKCWLAVADGRVWYSHDQWGYLTSMDEAAPHAVTQYTAFGSIYSPNIASVPGHPTQLLVSETSIEPANTWLLDVSGTDPTVVSSTSGDQLEGDLIAAAPEGGSAIFGGQEIDFADFQTSHQYPVPGGRALAAAVSPDGAAVAFASEDDQSRGMLSVIPRGGDAPLRTIKLGDVEFGFPRWWALGFSTSDDTLFALYTKGYPVAPVQFRVLSHPQASTTSIELSARKSVVTYGHSLKLTAHLDASSTNRTVRFYATPVDGSQRLVATADLDRSGSAQVKVHPKRHTTYVAYWSGDRSHVAPPSASKLIHVRVAVSGKLHNADGRSGRYRIYRFSSRCNAHGKGCPRLSAKVAPNHAGKPLHFELQVFTHSRWRSIGSARSTLSRSSHASAVFVYAPAARGHRFRMAAWFNGDAHNSHNHTGWKYLKVV